METAAGVTAARGVSLPMPSSQSPRKEWRVVSEQSARSAGSEDSERSKLGQSDERTIYEVQQGREPADVDFCSITIDGSLDSDILQQHLHRVARQREDLQNMEIGLRAKIVARSELMIMQKTFEDQIKEHANANVKLQEQLHQKEQAIHELERKMEDKDRELHAIKLDNEAAWAKEDLLREQNKELQTFRRERDTSEAERSQHLKQIHDLQEHVQDRERQFIELQEQNRATQEAIMFKDEQLREAQAWITRVQEMDALQSNTNHNLQAELRERTEQYNQLWLGCQRQFAEMERLHLHTVQQLQLELADVRDRIGTCPDESRLSQANSNDSSQFGQNGNQLDANGSVTSTANSGILPNGNAQNVSSYVSTGNPSTQADHVHGVPIAPSSLLGMPSYLPPGQVTALHPFVMHQQGVPNSVPSHVSQSHVGQFQSVPAIPAPQHWQNQPVQDLAEGLQVPNHSQYPPSQSDHNSLRPDTNFDYEASVNGHTIRPEYLEVHFSQEIERNTVVLPSAEEGQVLKQVDKSYLVSPPSQESLQHISSQFHEALRLDPLPQNSESEVEKTTTVMANHVLEGQGSTTEQACSPADASSVTPVPHARIIETTLINGSGVVSSEAFVSSGQKNLHAGGKSSETALLDERSLLACIVRTIPPGSGGRIRISSTLPNRLGKMLAPLHWHDYKKKYGKLDDFVAGHPELFVIEGDSIQLREGAQEIIAATAAVAKVAAAAKTASTPYSSLLPSVAVTPMAQSHRLKRDPAVGSNSYSHHSVQNQLANGTLLDAGSITNIKILSKPKDSKDLNGSESMPGQLSGLATANSDRSGLGNFLSKGSTHGSSSSNFIGKLQERRAGIASNSRR